MEMGLRKGGGRSGQTMAGMIFPQRTFLNDEVLA
jgi:hypothetical protein